MNPLATRDQFEAEALATRLFEEPLVQTARAAVHSIVTADPVSQTFDGLLNMERALTLWIRCLCFRETNSDPYRPKVIWSADDTPHEWVDGIYHGGGMGIDNTDNIHREIPIAGDSEYEITGRYSSNPTANLSFKLEVEPFDHAGIGDHLFMLTSQEIAADREGNFTLTLSRESASGRTNHIQIADEPLQVLWVRDSRSDWTQEVTSLAVRRTAGPTAPPELSYEQLVQRVVDFMPAYVKYWSGFKYSFLGHPEPNSIVGPVGRAGGWGYMAGGRYEINEETGLLVTTHDCGARYRGFQATDPWTMAPDPIYRQTSLNSSQKKDNPDGTATYVIAAVDPGIHNWVDTGGNTLGWYLIRWQGLDQGIDPAELVRECKLVRLDELDQHLPAGCPTVTLRERREQIVDRVRKRRVATDVVMNTPPLGAGIKPLVGALHD